MAPRERRNLFYVPDEIATVGVDQDRANALLREGCEGRFKIAIGSGVYNNELQTQRGRSHLQGCDHGLGTRIGKVRENAELGSIGYQRAEQLQSFRRYLGR